MLRCVLAVEVQRAEATFALTFRRQRDLTEERTAMSRRSTALSRYTIRDRAGHDGAATTLDTLPLPRASLPPPCRLAHTRQDEEGAMPSRHESSVPSACESRVNVISRQQLQNCRHWQRAFASQHKDRRYYEIVEDTIHPEFDYWYFAIRNHEGEIQAIQPSFILDQDILAGIHRTFGRLIDAIRVRWSRFMFMKTMMVGCVAGEAHLDDGDDSTRAAAARSLACAIAGHQQALGRRVIVLEHVPNQ